MRQKSPALPANRMAKACPGVLPACLALALLLTMLSGTRHTMAAESDAGRAARADSALQGCPILPLHRLFSLADRGGRAPLARSARRAPAFSPHDPPAMYPNPKTRH